MLTLEYMPRQGVVTGLALSVCLSGRYSRLMRNIHP